MKIYRYNRQEFEATLVKGYDWKDRCEMVGNAVDEILAQSPVDKVYRAGAMTSAILKAYDIPRDRANPFHKIVSAVITQLGKQSEYAQHITLGKEIRCGVQPDGSARYARERLWKANASSLAPAEIRGASIDKVWIDELSAQPEHKSSEFTHGAGFISMWMGIRFDELKDHPEQFAVFKEWVKENTGVDMDSVQGVDNPNISKHPSPGATRVDCGQCGGSGKVYMKQEPTS